MLACIQKFGSRASPFHKSRFTMGSSADTTDNATFLENATSRGVIGSLPGAPGKLDLVAFRHDKPQAALVETSQSGLSCTPVGKSAHPEGCITSSEDRVI